MSESPWMTPKQVAAYTQRHPETVYLALHAFVSSNGREGLRGSQPRVNACWRIHRDDVDAWMAGEKPAKARRLHVAGAA